MSFTRVLIVTIAIGAAACQAAAQRPAPPVTDRPRLAVILVVDQMRHDYLTRMDGRWRYGLKRLLAEGAVFDETRYPYLQTVTCAGHATIGTGTFPASHGIILNAWWRGTRSASCTDDPDARAIGYEAGAEAAGHSGRQLLRPTLGDRLREAGAASRVVTLSIKPRSAIMLAGQAGIVTWVDDANVMATSSAFGESAHPAVKAWIDAHPRTARRGEVWRPMAAADQYTGLDDGPGEAPPRGWTTTFPHPLSGAPGTPDPQFFTLWETSPYADAYLGDLAAALVTQLELGRGTGVDLLGVSFSALDYVGHAFGPESHEVQDTLLRLDETIGKLLDHLDTQVGRGRYVLGLSADHGVAPVPEARRLAGLDGGRIVTSRLVETANQALAAPLGPGRHVVRADYTQLYLSADARRRVEADRSLLRPALDALAAIPGVDRAFPTAGLEHEHASADPTIRAAALSHVPGRSGDIVVIPKPYYVIGAATASGTTHGTLHPYDQHVPLIFFGAGITAGRLSTPATPADLAPTLAAALGVALPDVDGRALGAALGGR